MGHLLLSLAMLALTTAPTTMVRAEQADNAATRTQLSAVFEKLRDAERKDGADLVRIAWWGDSAIVGDGFTGQLRQRLQARFGDGGPGFTLPSTTFPGYLREGVRLKRHHWKMSNVIQGNLQSGRYGLGGIQSTSYGGAGATFESTGAGFDRVTLFHREGPKLGGFQVFADGGGEPHARTDASAEAHADTTWTVALPAGTKKVRVRAAGGGQSVLYGVALERSGPGVVLDALGLLGVRARRWQNADEAHLKAQVAARAPDLIVVNFGGNERVDNDLSVAKHTEEIADVLKRFRAGAPDAACMVVGPIAHGRDAGDPRLDPALDTIYAAQRAVARDAGCAFLDTVALQGGPDAVKELRAQKFIGADLAHLNGKGHRALGDLMADWVLGHYDAWKATTAAR